MDNGGFRLRSGLAFPIPVVQRLPLEQYQERVSRYNFNKVDSSTDCHCPEAHDQDQKMAPKTRNKARANTKPVESFEKLHRSANVCLNGCYGEKRSEEFYDMFLASSVKESQAYQEVLRQREFAKASAEKVVCYLGDAEIQRTVDNLKRQGLGSVNYTDFDSGVSLGNTKSLVQNSVFSAVERIEQQELAEQLGLKPSE